MQIITFLDIITVFVCVCFFNIVKVDNRAVKVILWLSACRHGLQTIIQTWYWYANKNKFSPPMLLNLRTAKWLYHFTLGTFTVKAVWNVITNMKIIVGWVFRFSHIILVTLPSSLILILRNTNIAWKLPDSFVIIH
jgi:hypothetical protein